MLIVAAIRHRLADQRGFTLIELLVSMLISMVVFSAVLTITNVAQRSAARTSDRAETTQRSRTAMTRVVAGLRNQVCPSATVPPVASATKDSDGVEQLTYYTEQDTLTPSDPSPTFAPQKRRLTFDPRSGGSIVEEVFEANGTGSPPAPPFTWPTTPTLSRTLATEITRVGTTDFLRYYGFENSTPLTVPLSTVTTRVGSTPVPANSIAKVVRIDVSFRTLPSNGNTDPKRDSDMETTVYLRNSDYTSQTAASADRVWGPRCD